MSVLDNVNPVIIALPLKKYIDQTNNIKKEFIKTLNTLPKNEKKKLQDYFFIKNKNKTGQTLRKLEKQMKEDEKQFKKTDEEQMKIMKDISDKDKSKIEKIKEEEKKKFSPEKIEKIENLRKELQSGDYKESERVERDRAERNIRKEEKELKKASKPRKEELKKEIMKDKKEEDKASNEIEEKKEDDPIKDFLKDIEEGKYNIKEDKEEIEQILKCLKELKGTKKEKNKMDKLLKDIEDEYMKSSIAINRTALEGEKIQKEFKKHIKKGIKEVLDKMDNIIIVQPEQIDDWYTTLKGILKSKKYNLKDLKADDKFFRNVFKKSSNNYDNSMSLLEKFLRDKNIKMNEDERKKIEDMIDILNKYRIEYIRNN
jgi:Trp operon repressor